MRLFLVKIAVKIRTIFEILQIYLTKQVIDNNQFSYSLNKKTPSVETPGESPVKPTKQEF